MVFSQDVIHAGVLPGFRFSPRSDVFMTPRSYPENSCFCDGAEKELCDMIGDGMFAISSCQFDAPIILSWPHFLHANQSYLNSLTGLTPDAEKHSFYFDVQPTTGTTLAAKARIQVSNLSTFYAHVFRTKVCLKLSREKTFACKIRAINVDEIDHRSTWPSRRTKLSMQSVR